MGNIRIKDIATTATSSASDDFIGIDGATNGTRKLNAYSPSFGGTLFVGTATDSSNGKIQLATHTTSAGGIGFGTDTSLYRASNSFLNIVTTGSAVLSLFNDGSNVGLFRGTSSANAGFYCDTNSVYFRSGNPGGASNALKLASDLQVQVLATTASTSTSTGALVVSGGVGVAGNGVFGGNLVAYGTGSNTFAGQIIVSKYNESAAPSTASSDYQIKLQAAQTNGYYNNTICWTEGTVPNAAIAGYDNGGSGAQGIAFFTGNNTAISRALLLDSSQNATFAKAVTAGGVIVNKDYTVATLPAASSYTYGTCAVSDATNAAGTGLGTSPTGGGSVKRMVYSDGSNWLLL